MKQKKFFRRAAIAAAIIAAAVLLYLLAVYACVFYPSFTRYVPTDDKNLSHFKTEENYETYKAEAAWFMAQPSETIAITSDDGLHLVAYNLPRENAVGTIILMHGYHSEPIREYAALAHFYHDLGYNLVLPYQRTHGGTDGMHSEGSYITFGVKERLDLRGWMLKANELYGADNPLFVQGISMGCATAVMALGLDLPPNVRGVIADCGFTTPREIIWKVLKYDMKIPTARIIMRVGNVLTNRLAGFDMDECSTLEAIEFNKARKSQIPIIFIHGTNDQFVPIEMSEKNFGACLVSLYNDSDGSVKILNNAQQEKYELVEIPNAAHAIENLSDPDIYRKKVSAFFEAYGAR